MRRSKLTLRHVFNHVGAMQARAGFKDQNRFSGTNQLMGDQCADDARTDDHNIGIGVAITENRSFHEGESRSITGKRWKRWLSRALVPSAAAQAVHHAGPPCA